MGMTVIVRNAVEALELKAQVEELCARSDFAWKYTPAVNTWLGDDVITPATVEFDFKDQQWATYFQLRWAQ